jgi:four helix bundle protein
MSADIQDLRDRTKRFAFDIINLTKALPRNIATDAIARQLIKAGTSVCANHRAAGRARSRGEFIAKLGVVVEESDESELWLEALLKCHLAPSDLVAPLYREACELRAIFVQSLQTARRRSLTGVTTIVFVILFVFFSFLVS